MEQIAYRLVRLGLAGFGLLLLLFGLVDVFAPPPPSDGPTPLLGDRLPGAVALLAVGVLYATPFGWTVSERTFWPRMVVSILAGAVVAFRGLVLIGMGLAGGRAPLIHLVGLWVIQVGVFLPAALWWRHRRLTRRAGPESRNHN